jgi:Flp pilus assembly protein TadG
MVKEQKGQTLIETALILFLLLLILLGISEFARAWYTKNSLKNAVRHGARIAVVTPTITALANQPCGGTSCPVTPASSTDVMNCVCSSPGVRNDGNTTVSIEIPDDNGNGAADPSETIRVSATATFEFIVSGSVWPWPTSTSISTDASMRYE